MRQRTGDGEKGAPMDLRQLREYLVFAEELNYSLAAKRLLNFLKGGALMGGAAAIAGLVGCAPASEPLSDTGSGNRFGLAMAAEVGEHRGVLGIAAQFVETLEESACASAAFHGTERRDGSAQEDAAAL